MKQLRTLPIFVLLVPLFYVMHSSNAYFNSYPFRYPAHYFLLYLMLSLVIYGIGWLVFKRRDKAAVWNFIALMILLFFGVAADFLRGHRITSFISSYKILLPVIPVVIIALAIYLRRSSQQFSKLVLYLNLLFIVLITIEIVQLINQKIFARKEDISVAGLTLPPLSQQPDIFFIVFDEYTSSTALQTYFQYDNHSLDSILRANHFYVVAESKANYNYTPFSIASSFDLQYLEGNYENTSAETGSLLKGTRMVKKGFLPGWLDAQGYRVVNLGIFSFDKHPAPELPYFLQTSQQIFYQETLWNRVDEEIGYHFREWWPSWRPDLKANLHLKERHAQRMVNLAQELNSQTQPKFVYVHFLMPHAPFLLDRNGADVPENTNATKDSLYLEQLRYCNHWITNSIAPLVATSFKRPRMILIEGDHGLREFKGIPAPRELQTRNLSAVYFSDGNYAGLYDSISPINLMRVAMNKYFKAGLPLLKDSTIALY